MEDNLDIISGTLSRHGYKYVSKLGEGSFAAVLKVYSPLYKRFFAAKVFAVGVPELSKNIASYSAEVKALSSIYHQNIISIYNYFYDETHLYIILEYCSGGSLGSFLATNRKISTKIVLKWLNQSLKALSECHKLGISHHDIKPSNLLLDQYGRVKLADFGLSIINDKRNMSLRFGGSRPFAAPEIYKGQRFQPFKSDIWALGMTFYAVTFGKLPFTASTNDELAKQIIDANFEIPDALDPKINAILSLMLQKDPEKRPSCEELLCQFFVEVRKSIVVPQIPNARKPKTNLTKQKATNQKAYRRSLVVDLPRTPLTFKNQASLSGVL